MIHAYSLVHDDMPAMDDDVLPPGQADRACEFDEVTAFLVGRQPAEPGFPDVVRASACGRCAPAGGNGRITGARQRFPRHGRGQAFDLESTAKTLAVPELEFMHIRKTGALIRASVALAPVVATR